MWQHHATVLLTAWSHPLHHFGVFWIGLIEPLFCYENLHRWFNNWWSPNLSILTCVKWPNACMYFQHYYMPHMLLLSPKLFKYQNGFGWIHGGKMTRLTRLIRPFLPYARSLSTRTKQWKPNTYTWFGQSEILTMYEQVVTVPRW